MATSSCIGGSTWTVRKWRRRSLKLGRIGLRSQTGRPATGPVSTFPHELQQALLRLRKLHPGWGPATLLAALKTDAYWRQEILAFFDFQPTSLSNGFVEGKNNRTKALMR